MNVYQFNQHNLNSQAKQLLDQNNIPCDLTMELAAVTLMRVAIQSNLLSTPTLPEPELLIAKLAANPILAMELMTESEPGMEIQITLSPTLAEAAAEILEEVVASLQAKQNVLQ